MDTNYYKKELEKELNLLEEELRSVGIRNPSNLEDWIAKQPEENISPADENEIADTIDDYENNTAILKDLEIRYNSHSFRKFEQSSNLGKLRAEQFSLK